MFGAVRKPIHAIWEFRRPSGRELTTLFNPAVEAWPPPGRHAGVCVSLHLQGVGQPRLGEDGLPCLLRDRNQLVAAPREEERLVAVDVSQPVRGLVRQARLPGRSGGRAVEFGRANQPHAERAEGPGRGRAG